MRAVAIALVLLAAPALHAQAAAPDKAVQELEAKLAEQRKAAAALAAKETSLLGQLTALERLVAIEGRSLRAAQQRLKQGNKRLAAGEERLQRTEGELQVRTRALAPRLLARYKMGREGFLRFLLGARSLGDVLRRRKLLAAIVQHDIEALADLRVAAADARAARDELLAAKEALAESASAEVERRRSLEGRVRQQKRLIASTQQERAAHEQAVRELEEAARALQKRLADIAAGKVEPPEPDDKPVAKVEPPRPMVPPVPFKKMRRKLAFPVEGGRIEVRFGRRTDRRFGTVTLQRGIDIRAPEGSPVLAVHDGRVVHSGWFRGYGNLVILDHGENYYSLMAHLGTLQRAVGDEVRSGEAVGTVGDTGSLKGPFLYFELRQGTKPIDPERWLTRKRKSASKQAAVGGP